jgi:hypothetical protein
MFKKEAELVKTLKKEFPTLTEFEALSIACKIRQNDIMISAFNIHPNDKYPTNLEAIGMALGYGRDSYSSLKDSLANIGESLAEIASTLQEKNS